MVKERRQPRFKQITVIILITAFQLLCCVGVLIRQETISAITVYTFLGYIALEWIYMALGTAITGHDYFELEAIAFFLSGIGLTVCATFNDAFAYKQLFAILLGIVVYLAVILLTKDVNVACMLRYPAAIGSILILAANLVLAKSINGTLNWIDLGFFSIQPSELVKVSFIFVGAVSLEKLLSSRSLTKYLIFCIGCVGALFLMKDFGTALIFFFTFILIAFMRSGDVRTIFFICTGALLCAILIFYFKDHVAQRFEAYRHVWEYMDTTGYQQSRALIYISSGGLFGLGIGEGHVRDIYAASTDMVFALICEEFGLILGIAILLCFIGIAFFAIHASRTAGSTFYTIAAVSAAGMMLFQLALNVFGITDILPLTGVTLPFVSRGGSSMICSWGLLAYIRMASAPFVPPEADPRPLPVSKKTRTAKPPAKPTDKQPPVKKQNPPKKAAQKVTPKKQTQKKAQSPSMPPVRIPRETADTSRKSGKGGGAK
ncbi:MAG: FtsW/RodA/SpoVE family cell cycle protein [Clostridia bacterium]|nr:FtsW/RodA/SpoVE family cell cycle protein [Clostridia bacterium]